jgi:hypothetical protein
MTEVLLSVLSVALMLGITWLAYRLDRYNIEKSRRSGGGGGRHAGSRP